MFRNDDGYRWTFELISLRVVVVLCVVSHCSINGDAGAQSYTSDYAVAGQQRFPTSDENGRDSLLNRLVSTTASDAHNISDQTEALKSSHGSGLSLNSDTQRSGEKILSRRRRYLIFPPGSSVQIGNFVCSFPATCDLDLRIICVGNEPSHRNSHVE